MRERIDYDGSVHVAARCRRSWPTPSRRCASAGSRSVAVGLLNSYVNDAHERAVADALRAALPGVAITASAALVREEREYERFSTAVVNAALLPVVRGYLERLGARRARARHRGAGLRDAVQRRNGRARVRRRAAGDAGRERAGRAA